ncbi:MAG: histidine kinase [Herbaspirillum sp.]|jgi:two-component system sensor histidine kinase TctE|nr:histidine kinase [Herbaspirillum sp.]
MARAAPIAPSSDADEPHSGDDLMADSAERAGAEPSQHSLFGEILDWMLAPLLLLWPMSIAVTYLIAQSIANHPFDRALEDNVTILAQHVGEMDNRSGLSVPARDLLRADEVDTVYYQITGADGSYIDGDRELPQPPLIDKKLPIGVVQFYNTVLHGNDVRIAYATTERHPSQAQHAENDAAPAHRPQLVLVQVGETLEKRALLANDIIKGVILPQFVILPIALALIWFALARGLSPLSELQRRIRMRRPDDLSPIEPGQVPEEISPLVGSLNDMLVRLAQTIEVQKRFIADAAHQMKTPLAGMRMQAELALRQTDGGDIHRSLEQVAKSSETATRLVNQLLSLARAENIQSQTTEPAAVELASLARDTMHDLVPLSLARQIDLGFEQPSHPVTIAGDPILLRELLVNLLDNALHYTPRLGSVTVRTYVNAAKGAAVLEVEDTGPGIPTAERRLVFDRFYRILGTRNTGSGLGLAIVREIALQHNATVDIFHNPRSRDPKWPGSLFRVTFHLPPHDDDRQY